MMSHEEIKKDLKNKGISFSALAKASGRKYQTLTAVSNRSAVSKPCALVICAGLGKDISDVFPDVEQYNQPSRQEAAEESLKKARKALKKADIEIAVA